MKKYLLIVIGLLLLQPWTQVGAQYQVDESFESAVPPTGWLALDNDNDGYNWFQYQYSPHTGAYSAATASWWQGVILTPDNYLITPQVNLSWASELIYWVASQDPAYPTEHYSVLLSTTGTAPADFTVNLYEETLSNDTWLERIIDLSSYSGMGYIAFRHYNVSDQFVMKIDDVQIDMALAIDLLSFIARQGQNSVVIRWATGSELDCYGFNLIRSRTVNGIPVEREHQINDLIIPAEGTAFSGAKYEFQDFDVKPGTIHYTLEEVSVYGDSVDVGETEIKIKKGIVLR